MTMLQNQKSLLYIPQKSSYSFKKESDKNGVKKCLSQD